jgi:hypothetical protein
MGARAAVVVAVALLAAAPADAATVLTQRDANGTSVLTLAPNAAKSLVTADGDRAPSFGTILRYDTGRAIAFDSIRRVYVDLSLSAALASARARHRALRFPRTLPSGLSPPAIPRLRATLHQLGPVTLRGVRGVSAEVLEPGTAALRVAYATGLPTAPVAFRRALSDPALRASPLDRALGARLGDVPLRIQAREGGAWVTTLDTISSREVAVPASAFAVPLGLRRVTPAAFFSSPTGARSATSALAVRIDPDWPVVTHPRITNLFWGGRWNDNSPLHDDLNSATNVAAGARYGSSLVQYGVVRLPGSRKRSHIRAGSPPRAVGDTGAEGTYQVLRFIADQQIHGRAPLYWVCCGRDPMIFVFVFAQDVAAGSWNGYHMYVPTIGSLVPWPLNMWIQPGLPYTVVKASVGDTAGATNTLSHEYVEAATDPLPFFGWADFAKEPVWTKGELADICEGDPQATTGFPFEMATYWSNFSHRCAP